MKGHPRPLFLSQDAERLQKHIVTQLKRTYVFRRLFPQTDFLYELLSEATVNKNKVAVTAVVGIGADV